MIVLTIMLFVFIDLYGISKSTCFKNYYICKNLIECLKKIKLFF
jgi:hypothetical protein